MNKFLLLLCLLPTIAQADLQDRIAFCKDMADVAKITSQHREDGGNKYSMQANFSQLLIERKDITQEQRQFALFAFDKGWNLGLNPKLTEELFFESCVTGLRIATNE